MTAGECRDVDVILAWPAELSGDDGIEVPTVIELVTSDELDGEVVRMTDETMRKQAGVLSAELEGFDVSFCAIHPDMTRAGDGPWPFTHLMRIDDDAWDGPRYWAVVLADTEEGQA